MVVLEPYRVLDLTDEKGLFCGKVFADLGADVIQVEPPQGNPARRLPPFWQGQSHPEKSLHWFAFSAGKRSVTLDIEREAGRHVFMALCRTADFLIESFPVGYLERIGLGYSALSAANPRLIMASITPFGSTGPYGEFKAGDLVAAAMGGMVYCTGDPDRPPVRISADQAYCQASLHAAIGLLVALADRVASGKGQHVDVSLQASMVRTLHTQLPYWEYGNHIVRRSGAWRFRGGAATREIWPCKDGFVSWMFFGGAVGTQQMRSMVEWMKEKGMDGPLATDSEDWSALDLAKVAPQKVKAWEEIIGRFFMAFTKAELYGEALQKRIPLTPLNGIAEVMDDAQLASREFWIDIDHPDLGVHIPYPGAFFRTTDERSAPRVRRRAPRLGEHNDEVYVRELGLSRDEVASLRLSNTP